MQCWECGKTISKEAAEEKISYANEKVKTVIPIKLCKECRQKITIDEFIRNALEHEVDEKVNRIKEQYQGISYKPEKEKEGLKERKESAWPKIIKTLFKPLKKLGTWLYDQIMYVEYEEKERYVKKEFKPKAKEIRIKVE